MESPKTERKSVMPGTPQDTAKLQYTAGEMNAILPLLGIDTNKAKFQVLSESGSLEFNPPELFFVEPEKGHKQYKKLRDALGDPDLKIMYIDDFGTPFNPSITLIKPDEKMFELIRAKRDEIAANLTKPQSLELESVDKINDKAALQKMLLEVEKKRFELLQQVAGSDGKGNDEAERLTLADYLKAYKEKTNDLSLEDLRSVLKESIKETKDLDRSLNETSRIEGGDNKPSKKFLQDALDAALSLKINGELEAVDNNLARTLAPNVPWSIEIPGGLGARQ